MDTKRRAFLKQNGILATALTLVPSAICSQIPDPGDSGYTQILKKLSKINDLKIEGLLALQVTIPGDRWDGGVTDEFALPNAHSTNWFIVALGSSYASPFSNYFLSAKLENPLLRAIHCLLNVQHDDGTIDLHSTNFHSTPDTAFLVNFLSPVLVVLKRLNKPGIVNGIEQLEQFILNAGKCLLVGGIHTANHRWVVCSALAKVHSFFPDQKYIDRIEEWLGEGIDIDPDGQYTEQSVASYSPIINNMFLTMGRLLDRPEFFEIVRKNLEMTLYYIQPGLEVLTDASGRQDSAQIRYIDSYYYAYRYLAIKDKNPVFAALCKQMEDLIPEKIADFASLPAMLMEDPIFEKPLPAPTKIPDSYFKKFSHSGVFRIRRGNADLSIIEKNPTFLVFMKGRAVLQSLRLHAAFFGSRGQFIGEEVLLEGNTIILKKSKVHGYFQPFPKDKRTGDGDWEKMPREERKMSEIQTIHYRVSIVETEGKVLIEIKTDGTSFVPVSIEMNFRYGGVLSGVIPDTIHKNVYFLEGGMGKYQVGNDVIHFGPGSASHKWAQMRGMLPKQEGESVYLTGFTPFSHTIELS